MPRSRPSLALPALLGLLLLPVASPQTTVADPPAEIAWEESLPKALARARAEGKPVMICINATRVAQKSWRLEPAAKELREKTYRHPQVVALSRRFCCFFLSSEGTAEDFGELRARFQIDGDIVSPQHVFAYPDGRLLHRKEYWPYGTGPGAVDALLRMMYHALAKHHERLAAGGATDGAGDTSDRPPADPEGRTAWIAAQLDLVDGADEIARRDALRRLVDADEGGDVVAQLEARLHAYGKDRQRLYDVVRELGRPGLGIVVADLCRLLEHEDAETRAYAAVSLEYVGSASAVPALRARVAREPDVVTANHIFRALGRCGAYDAGVRRQLLAAIPRAEREFATFGPIIGLAYFEQDPETARELETLIRDLGMPPTGRDGRRGHGRRHLLAWCLSEVGFGDPVAAAFVRDVLIPASPAARGPETLRTFYEAVLEMCRGDEGARRTVENMARRSVSGGGAGGEFGGAGSGDPSLTDAPRLRRRHVDFTPKGEFGPVGD